MATNQKFSEYRVNSLPTSGLQAGDRYYLSVGGGKYKTFIVSDSGILTGDAGAEFIEKDTVSQMRALTSREIWALENGYYKGVRLHGYYTKGDTPAPIEYYLSETTESEDGGSVFEVGGIKLKHEFVGEVDVRYFGVFGDGFTDYSKKFQYLVSGTTSFSVHSLYIPTGEYIVKERVYIRAPINIIGDGVSNTIINYEDFGGGFRFINPVETPLTITSDISIGDTVIKCHTSGIEVGDFIRISSLNTIRRHWGVSPLGDEVKWSEGEMLKVLEVREDEVVLTEGSYFEYKTSEIRTSTFFKLLEGGSMDGIFFKTNQPSDSAGIGFRVIGVQNYKIGNLKFEGFNFAGIQVNASYNITINKLTTTGGDNSLGLNYGIMVSDGSKYIHVNHVNGFGHRHTVAGGGSGWAIPMKVSFVKVEHESFTDIDFHGVDAHSNCAQWSFNVIHSTHGVSICGLDHVIDNVTSLGGAFFLAYDGGRNIRFGKVYHKNPSRYYTLRPIYDITIDQLIIECEGNTSESVQWSWNNNSNSTYIKEARYINLDSDKYLDDDEASSKSPLRLLINTNTTIDKLTMKGFGRLLYNGRGIRINNAHVIDCGWTGSHSPFNQGMITIPSAAVEDVYLGNLEIENRNENLTFNTSAIRVTQSSGLSKVTIEGVQNKNKDVIFTNVVHLSEDVDNVVLSNINAKGNNVIGNIGGRNIIVRNSKYLNNIDTYRLTPVGNTLDGSANGVTTFSTSSDIIINVSSLVMGSEAWARIINTSSAGVNVSLDVTPFIQGSATSIEAGETGYLQVKNIAGSYFAVLHVKAI